MHVRYIVELTDLERKELRQLTSSGAPGARVIRRAQILFMADQGALDKDICAALGTGSSTVYRTRQRWVEGGLEHALHDRRRPGGERKLSGREEALLIAVACSDPPEGRARWTLELLAGEIVRLTDHRSLSPETVRRRLQENEMKPWRKEMWCIPSVDNEYVARMENVLELYAETPDLNDPIVSFDESPVQLTGEARTPLPPAPGRPRRYDYEYRRNGTANLFIFLGVGLPWRHVKVTDRRTNVDFAECMRDLADVHFPEAQRIRVVLDNLSTHHPGALYDAYPPAEARRILRRLEFHFTPRHASWLNMVELEIGVLNRQCLNRRIGDRPTLESEIAAWLRGRNDSGAVIRWMFSVKQARERLPKMYDHLPPAVAARDAA